MERMVMLQSRNIFLVYISYLNITLFVGTILRTLQNVLFMDMVSLTTMTLTKGILWNYGSGSQL